jgi:hypothetical protein
LVERLGKDPRDITQDDFISNRVYGAMKQHGDSPYSAISEAFPELEINPWEMLQTPHGFYKKKENRVAAVRWLVEKLGKDPRDITADDFQSNRLWGLFDEYYRSSPYEAISEAFPDIKPWEMVVTPRSIFEEREKRIAAVRWLIEKLGKDARDITQGDFYSNRLVGLLSTQYSNSPYEALLEAGLVTEQDEGYMRKRWKTSRKE